MWDFYKVIGVWKYFLFYKNNMEYGLNFEDRGRCWLEV